MQLVGANGGNGGNGRNTAGKEGISVKWETHLTQNGGNAGMGSGHILIERMKVHGPIAQLSATIFAIQILHYSSTKGEF